jgi:recombination protein RecA
MSQLKTYIQSLVTEKIPEAFTLKKAELPRKIPTGIQPLDHLIQGFQRGDLTEIYGQGSSGRTTLAISFMAEVTRRAEACALVDVSDSLDTESLSVADVNLDQLLWIRCGKASEASPDSSLIDQFNSCLTQSHPLPNSSVHQSNFSSGRHPRQEVRGLSNAIATMMRGPDSLLTRPAGTLSLNSGKEYPPPALPCTRGDSGVIDSIVPTGRREEENCERIQLPSLVRRGQGGGRESCWTSPLESPLTKGDTCNVIPKPIFSQLRGKRAREGGSTPGASLGVRSSQGQVEGSPERQTIWKRLEQALRVTDLLLNNGGFGAIVLDLGDVPIENARRIPLTSWFRFRRSVENTPTALVLLSKEPCCGTCASLVLHCQNHHIRWCSASGSTVNSYMSTLEGLDLVVGKARCRGQFQAEVMNGGHSTSASSISWQTYMSWVGE